MSSSTLIEVFGHIVFSFTRGVTEHYNPEEPEFTAESFGYDPLQSTGREWYYLPVDELIYQEYSDREATSSDYLASSRLNVRVIDACSPEENEGTQGDQQNEERAMAWKRLRPSALRTVCKSMYIGALICFLSAVVIAYNKQNDEGKLIIALFAPLIGVAIETMSRICVQRLWNYTHPGFSYVLLAPMYYTYAVLFRVLQADLEGLQSIAILGIIHGAAEVIERSAMVVIDHICHVIWKRTSASWGSFRTPRRERLMADIAILSMLSESSAIVSVNGFLYLYQYVYLQNDSLLKLLQSFAIYTSVQLVIEWCFTSVSLAIETRYQNMAVMAVWRRRWKSFSRGVTEHYNPEEPEFTAESFGYDPLQSTGREWYYLPVDELIYQEYSDREITSLNYPVANSLNVRVIDACSPDEKEETPDDQQDEDRAMAWKRLRPSALPFGKSNEEGKLLIAVFSPLIGVVLKTVSRVGMQRYWNLSHPGYSYVLLAPLYFGTAIMFRVLQADLGSLQSIAILGVIHGAAEVIERSTMVVIDHIFHRICKRTPAPWGRFRTPRRERLMADIAIMSMLFESTAIVCVNGFMYLYKFIYMRESSLFPLLQSFAITTSVQLVIEWFFTSVSLAIETHYQNMAVMAVWRRRWKRHILVAVVNAVPIAIWTSGIMLNVRSFFNEAIIEPCKMPFT
ncbi:hypothetical protein ACROYT_G037878 [Oculina patagonica]